MSKDLFVSALLDVYGEFLPEKQRMTVHYYYNEDLSLSEIAENEGITRQGVRDYIKRAEIQLTQLEKRCGYCKKFLELKAISDNLRNKSNTEYKKLFDIIDSL